MVLSLITVITYIFLLFFKYALVVQWKPNGQSTFFSILVLHIKKLLILIWGTGTCNTRCLIVSREVAF